MQAEMLQAAHRRPEIERTRVAVALPPDATSSGEALFVPITWEDTNDDGAGRPRILRDPHGALPSFTSRRLIGFLCQDRATRTVDGNLKLWYGEVSPEDYLRLWREALKSPLTPAQLAERHGLCLRVTLCATLDRVRGMRCPWPNAPFETFEHLEAFYGTRLIHITAEAGETRFGLSLDLREPEAARHAFYVESLLAQTGDTQAGIRVTLGRVAQPPAPPACLRLAGQPVRGGHAMSHRVEYQWAAFHVPGALHEQSIPCRRTTTGRPVWSRGRNRPASEFPSYSDRSVDRDFFLSPEFACAVVAGYRDAPVALGNRDAVADIRHEWPLINAMAGLEGIAIQRDVVQNPASV